MFASFLVLRSLSLAARLREKRNIAKPNVQNEKQSGILAEFRSVGPDVPAVTDIVAHADIMQILPHTTVVAIFVVE